MRELITSREGKSGSAEEAVRRRKRISLCLKRGLDLIGATVGLLLLWPLMLLIACAVKLDSSGPVLFVQERAGKDGKPFRMYKLRSMVSNAEEMLDRLLDLEALASPAFKIRRDPRVTRVGRFLRRTSLDEIPQLWNVLKGEMSLVGPRPEELKVVRRYREGQTRRLAMKPGMTGPMQIDGRGALTFEERMELELAYIETFRLWSDVEILLRTLPAVVRGKGAY